MILLRILWLIVSAPVRWVRFEARLLREASGRLPVDVDRTRDGKRAA